MSRTTPLSPADLAQLLRETEPPSPRELKAVDRGGKQRRESRGGIRSEEGTTAFASSNASSASARLPELKGQGLEAWDEREEVAFALARLIGISAIEGEESRWKVAAHVLQVTLWRETRRGIFILVVHRGWPLRRPRRSLSLAEAFAFHVMREVRILRRAEQARWKRRMLVELGFVELRLPALSPLPRGATRPAQQVWQALPLYLGIRWLTDPADEPFPLSAPWFSRWSGLPEATIRSGKAWLLTNGALVKVGEAPSQIGRATALFKVVSERDPDAHGIVGGRGVTP